MALLRSGGYGHHIQRLSKDHYRLSWRYDVKHGRVRFPRILARDTDRRGAQRFAKRWQIRFDFEAMAKG